MIPYFLRHYAEIVDRIYVFDDGSTDRSLELLRNCKKVRMRRFKHRSDAHCFDSRDLWEHAWKEQRDEADWVIACNLDEHLDHPNLRAYLERCTEQGVSLVPSPGYDMMTEEFPTFNGRLADRLRHGAPTPWFTKTCLFRPADIATMNYFPGRHSAVPEGRVQFPVYPEIRLLHYKMLGFDFVFQRHAQLAVRLRDGDRSRNMGVHYHRTAEELRAELVKIKEESIDVDLDDIRARLLASDREIPICYGRKLPPEPVGPRTELLRRRWMLNSVHRRAQAAWRNFILPS